MKPLKDQLSALERLQELDLKIDGLKRNKGALPAQLKTLDDSLARLNQQMETKKKAALEIEKVRSQTRAALELNQDRLTRSSTRLESVTNSQEFQAANKEIEQLNKMNSSLDEQIKKSTADYDAIEQELKKLTEEYNQIKAERDEKAELVSGQSQQFETQIHALNSDRKQFTVNVEHRTLSLYDRVRVARAGLGIVPAVAGRCKGCNMVVPPQLYNMIQKCQELHTCPSCHRILYAPSNASSESAAATQAQ